MGIGVPPGALVYLCADDRWTTPLGPSPDVFDARSAGRVGAGTHPATSDRGQARGGTAAGAGPPADQRREH
ncbi:protein of unknown function [Blastococcus saxobsidens DD2]|uniref:Uncharacterized protein n=1 Tax=Blastococcus saxobsidens (strain DD2) TaxID=1146883 RepID=H6RK49_BLASD|nr:protein of unknown function [Blastococcus saxobsidens DD2]